MGTGSMPQRQENRLELSASAGILHRVWNLDQGKGLIILLPLHRATTLDSYSVVSFKIIAHGALREPNGSGFDASAAGESSERGPVL